MAVSTDFNNGRTALITGASSGIGEELSRLFARDGYSLVLVARRIEKLDRLAQELREKHAIVVKTIEKDLSASSASEEVFAELQRENIPVDILVNNAGFGTYGPFSETDLAAELQMMQVNMVTLTHLTRLFLPSMIRKNRGKILNVASTAAFQPGPLMAVYYASKAYVLYFSEALANELHTTGVTVTALCPGATASEFQKTARMEQSRLVRGKIMDAATVARIGYEGLMKGKIVVIPGLKHQLMALAPRFLPRNMIAQIVRRVQERV